MERFSKDGRLNLPLKQRKKGSKESDEVRARYVVTEAYCPNGCNIIDMAHEIDEASRLRFEYKRPGVEGEFVFSAFQGDFDKIILSGELEKGVKDDSYGPYCGVMFKKLVSSNGKADADMVVIGLSPQFDFNNVISFCNVTGCVNGTAITSGEVIRHVQISGEV